MYRNHILTSISRDFFKKQSRFKANGSHRHTQKVQFQIMIQNLGTLPCILKFTELKKKTKKNSDSSSRNWKMSDDVLHC